MRQTQFETRNHEQNPPSPPVIYRMRLILVPRGYANAFDVLLVRLGRFCFQLIVESRIISINLPLRWSVILTFIINLKYNPQNLKPSPSSDELFFLFHFGYCLFHKLIVSIYWCALMDSELALQFLETAQN